MPLYAHADIEVTEGGDPNTRPTFRRIPRGTALTDHDLEALGDDTAAAFLDAGTLSEEPPAPDGPVAPPADPGTIDVRAGDGGDAEDRAVVA